MFISVPMCCFLLSILVMAARWFILRVILLCFYSPSFLLRVLARSHATIFRQNVCRCLLVGGLLLDILVSNNYGFSVDSKVLVGLKRSGRLVGTNLCHVHRARTSWHPVVMNKNCFRANLDI